MRRLCVWVAGVESEYRTQIEMRRAMRMDFCVSGPHSTCPALSLLQDRRNEPGRNTRAMLKDRNSAPVSLQGK